MAAPSKGAGYQEDTKQRFTTHAGKDLGLSSGVGHERRVPAKLRQRRERMLFTSSPDGPAAGAAEGRSKR